MKRQVALVIDDLAADRTLAARTLRQAGWTVYVARNSAEGVAQATMLNDAPAHSVILTDLHMPHDDSAPMVAEARTAGAYFALRLRARMARGEMATVPIVALTALSEQEAHRTALAFGCDAVLSKPITPDLAERIENALRELSEKSEPPGATALLGLLRCHLVEALAAMPDAAAPLSERDVTKALLAYRRQGLVGLGESTLAHALLPRVSSVLARGEQCYARLMEALGQIKQLGAAEALAILQGELVDADAPVDLSATLGLSRSEYYRRRREAIAVLLDLLTK